MLACVIGGPLVMLEKTGYLETWEATERYTLAVLAFSAAHPISVPGEAPAGDEAGHAAALRALDRRLIAWHRDLDALYDRICAMAVVSTLTDPGASVSLTYDRPAGVGQRALKREFHAKRDASILLYLALTAAVYFSNSVLLASLVLVLNVLNLLLCYRIKGMSDALAVTVQQLDEVVGQLVGWPLPAVPAAGHAAATSLLLAKLAALARYWQGTELGMNVALPGVGALAVSVNIMGSIAVATTFRCVVSVLTVFHPALAGISIRAMLAWLFASAGRYKLTPAMVEGTNALPKGASARDWGPDDCCEEEQPKDKDS
ncbi:hypothetical protein ACKKBF_B12370 [Auxenochlorella protothecoides x Auxenochlorella symbiontica]